VRVSPVSEATADVTGELSLDGRVVIVTGASEGLGASYARALAASGANVVITARRPDPLEKIAAELDGALAVVGDVADPGFAERAVTETLRTFGRIDALVNNAGIVRDRTLLKMSHAEFDEVVKTNLYGTFYMGQSCARAMRDRAGGTVINIGSDSGFCGAFGQSNYAAAKGAILGLTMTWAAELPRYGITCNCVLPNALTSMTEGLDDLLSAYRYGPPSHFPRALGSAEEAAPLIVLLASSRWSRLNGRLLSLGGDKLSLWRPPDESRTAFLAGGWSLAELDRSIEFALGPLGTPALATSVTDMTCESTNRSPDGLAHC
jgi:NAD(P)-dependent dehydrogenase (short-subunit alcohol dehydrogenase family)